MIDPASEKDLEAAERLFDAHQALMEEIGKVIIGQRQIVEDLLVALFSRGHCLIVGVPGLAKTRLVSTVARILDLSFSRIQFTPDLMPSDITGTEILEEDRTTGKKTFRFVKGPIFAHIVLADEINRTPPKTQAALLQAMQEHEVSTAGQTWPLPEPFFVLATQNPIEQEGTYPLPEAQLDRFMFNLWIDYPTPDEEKEIVRMTTGIETGKLTTVLDAQTILSLQELVRRVPVADIVLDYAVRLVARTRPTSPLAPAFVREWISWGAGPRASQYLILAAKSRAILHGRTTPEINDIRAYAVPVLRHRMVTNFNAEAEGVSSVEIIDRLLQIE